MSELNFRKIFLPIIFISVLFVVFRKCSFHKLPSKKIKAFALDFDEKYDNNEYRLTITNPVDCPNRFILSAQNEDVNTLLSANSPFHLEAKADTTIIVNGQGDLTGKVKIGFKWGDPLRSVHSTHIKSLPFPKGKSYELMQGNNSYPTHNHRGSRYAFDFTMAIGDTITSVQDGYIVTVIDGYNGWGQGNKWKPYSNQIMIYDPESYLFTMYGHLKQYGSFVELGQYVKVGEPIGLSGKTGQTSEAHLHFNVFRADNSKSGLTSYQLDSIGGYEVDKLNRYQSMAN